MARSVLNGLAVEGAVAITGRANATQLAIKAHSTQGANLIELQDNGGTPVMKLDVGGSITANSFAPIGTPGTGAYFAFNSNIAQVVQRSNGATVLLIYGASGQTGKLIDFTVTGTTVASVEASGLGDFSPAGIRTKHQSGTTPTGGSSGEVRVGTDKLWLQDAGTWKSVAVSAAGVPSFADRVKWGTD